MYVLTMTVLMLCSVASSALAQTVWSFGIVDAKTRYQINGERALAFGTSVDSLLVGVAGANNTGDDSVIIGQEAGPNNAANENVFIGYQAGNANTTGAENLFLGTWAGRDNTTAFGNTYLGYMAGRTNILGQQNTYVGWGVRSGVTAGSFNVFVGYQAGGEVGVSGDNNAALGYGAGQFNGNYNAALGTNAGSGGASVNSSISLGAGAVPTASNQAVIGGDTLGNGRVTSVYFGQGVTNATAAAVTLNTTGGSGSNIAGAAFNLAPGAGTGSATPSSIVFLTSTALGSGTTLQTNTEKWRIDGAAGGNLTAANGVDVVVPNLKSNSGTRFICADTNGKLVSSTSACSGT